MKERVVDALRDSLSTELAALERAAAATRDEVGNDEARQEGKYDTRSTEASYLARGQAWRIVELRRLSAWFQTLQPRPMDTVAIGALVHLDGPRHERVFLAPEGGARVVVDGQPVRVISPRSPMGAALAGLEAGDGFRVDTPRGPVEYEVLSVC